MAGYREFEFDLPGALLTHLVRALDGLEAAPLDADGLAPVQEAQGVYQLFLDGQLVYIGKTDAEAGLLKRLTRHSCKTRHRQGLDPARVTYKAIRIFVFTAIDLETQLIRHYGGVAGTLWNGSGFGANDPGRNRDHSRPGQYDTSYPIDIDRELEVNFGAAGNAAQVAQRVKDALPYTFRFEGAGSGRAAHPDLTGTPIVMPEGPWTARRSIAELVSQLPPGWQATRLSALIILYREHRDDYPQAAIIARSG